MKNKKKLNTLDKILVLCGSLLIAFTICMIVLFCLFQSVPDTLICAFFGAFGVETINCVMVYKEKQKRGKNNDTDTE